MQSNARENRRRLYLEDVPCKSIATTARKSDIRTKQKNIQLVYVKLAQARPNIAITDTAFR